MFSSTYLSTLLWLHLTAVLTTGDKSRHASSPGHCRKPNTAKISYK